MTFPWRSAASLPALLAFPAAPVEDEELDQVVQEEVREDGLVATYLRPKGEKTVPAVIVLGGSEGGIPTPMARLLAERGWGALAVGYFHAEGLPPSLANIPLEYLDGAVAWLQRRRHTDSARLSLVGGSRGAELALLVASRNPAFDRVVAIAPSSVAWGSAEAFSGKTVSAWAVGRRPLPCVPYVARTGQPHRPAAAYRGTPDFLRALRLRAPVEAAVIRVEKIRGAILLLSGEDDQVWPSSLMARAVMKRLADARHPFRFEHLSFPQAGHLIGPGSNPELSEAKHPVCGVRIAFGGTKEGNRAAQKLGWARALEFLNADPARPQNR